MTNRERDSSAARRCWTTAFFRLVVLQRLGDGGHRRLPNCVAAAYGWSGDITDDAALRELNARNRLDNATAGQSATDPT